MKVDCLEKAMDIPPISFNSNPLDWQPTVEGNTQFALALYEKLRTEDGNLCFSPYSISSALGMTYAGARGGTEAQMAQALHFTEQTETHRAFAQLRARMEEIDRADVNNLRIANRLWPHQRYPFLQSFLDICQEHYAATLVPMDYNEPETARQIINDWVAQETNEKIQDLLPSGLLDELTRLVLTNAVYFKGNWDSQFDKAKTETAPFWIGPSESVDAPLMQQQQTTFPYAETASLQIVELPFAGDDLALVILLPKERDRLQEVEESLSASDLDRWLGQLRPREVDLCLPRFRVNSSFRLDSALRTLGMVDAFDDAKADFSGMDGRSQWLYIAAVLHQAYLEANEEGAEAAAATAVVMKFRSMPPPPLVVRADHPFLFLLREKQTGSLLFMGRVINPVAQSD